MATKKRASKKTSKKTSKKRATKGQIPLKVLENRYKHLGNILKRRGSKVT